MSFVCSLQVVNKSDVYIENLRKLRTLTLDLKVHSATFDVGWLGKIGRVGDTIVLDFFNYRGCTRFAGLNLTADI
jgi:hypothetical protein